MRTATFSCATALVVFFCGSPGVSAGMAGPLVDVSSITSAQAAGGLKEALTQGIAKAVSETGRPGGFEDNPLIKIGMPDKLRFVETGLRAAGMGSQVDAFEHSMNSAAEQAAPAARSILMNALKTMTFADARQIVTGGRTAGTDYFRRTSSAAISEAFRPIVEGAMAKTGVTEKFDALMGSAPKLPFARTPTVNVNDYVLGKAVDGLFTMMGQEEARIRTDPAAQATPLLKTVFGSL